MSELTTDRVEEGTASEIPEAPDPELEAAAALIVREFDAEEIE